MGPLSPKRHHRPGKGTVRAASFVNGDYKWDSSVTHILKKLGWQLLTLRKAKTRLTMMFTIVNVAVVVNLDDYFFPQKQETLNL